jgi:hypothetical protein
MKGFSGIIAAVMVLVIVGVVIYQANLSWFWGETIEKKADITFHFYSMGNALDAAGLYAGVALDYSLYQACHDFLEHPGMGLDKEGFERELGSRTKDNLKVYTNVDYDFLDAYTVNIYDYDGVDIDTDSGKVTASGSNNMIIYKEDATRGMKIWLERRPGLERPLEIDCYGIYQEARQVRESLASKLEAALGKAAGTAGDPGSLPRESATEPDEEQLKDTLRGALGGDGGVVFSGKVDGNYVMDSVLAGVSVLFSWDGTSQRIEYTGLEATLTVTIKDTREDQAFPVYNGTGLFFSPLTMSFDAGAGIQLP